MKNFVGQEASVLVVLNLLGFVSAVFEMPWFEHGSGVVRRVGRW